jgi:predicted nucleic acid-binding protein
VPEGLPVRLPDRPTATDTRLGAGNVQLRKAIDSSEAAAAVHDLRRLDVELVPFEAVADRTWELRANLTIYDACYVATAELVRCRLVTLDHELAKAPGLRCDVAVAPPGAA